MPWLASFFPSPCRICEKLLIRATRIPICEDCPESFTPIPARACTICGQPLESFYPAPNETPLCPRCNPPTYSFFRARSLAIYQDQLVRALLILKYQRMEPLAKWFAVRMAHPARSEGASFEADMVVPVPLHRNRERERGYNQAALLARPLARALEGCLTGLSCLFAPGGTPQEEGPVAGGALGERPWRLCDSPGQPS